ncbi:hypothetical protein [Cerasicoccus fimbriatus]|uniref:hypothetical protein n=1 Tax=Cerasicoccus fimbriatus TaxID=3014554 RepID=UPI0022B49D84|nr:hypothetical protein [Cerasicoccus sp. TK19100]
MEIVKLLIKVAVILAGTFGVPLVVAFLANQNKLWRRVILCGMVLLLVRPPGNFTLMLYSVDWYRGHTKGFEFNLLWMCGVGLIIAAAMRGRKPLLRLPGLWAYALYIFAGCLSLVTAFNPLFGVMSVWKFGMIIIIAMGVCLAIEDEEDIHWILRAFAAALVINVLVCIKMRYLEGRYQIPAWFEHQNPMAMWCYFVGLPLLAVSLAKDIRFRDSLWYFVGFGAAGLSIIFSVSRASLAAIGAGAIFLLGASFLRGITPKRMGVLVLMGSAGSIVLLLAMDTLVNRFESSEDTGPENDLRWILNQQSRAMLDDSPVGIGWNSFGIANSRPDGAKYSKLLEAWNANRGHTIVAEHYYANPLTESHYWLILAETGYLAFAGFILFELCTIYWCVRGVWHYRKSMLGFLCLGIGVIFAITYLHSQLERVLTQTKNMSTWMVFVGVMMRIELWRRQGYLPATWDGKRRQLQATATASNQPHAPVRRRPRFLDTTARDENFARDVNPKQ